MVEHIAMRIINRIKQEVSAFIDESEGVETASSKDDAPSEILADVKDHLGKLIAEHHQITKTHASASQELKTLLEKIELAIDSGRDDLARAALIRRNGLQRQISSLDLRLKDIEAETLEVEALIEDLSAEAGETNDTPSANPVSALNKQLGELDELVSRRTGKPGNTQT